MKTEGAIERMKRLIDECCCVKNPYKLPSHQRRQTTNANIDKALEVCDIVKMKISHAWIALDHLSQYYGSVDEYKCIQALFILDSLMINCGYPVHAVFAERKHLNRLCYRFPPTPATLNSSTSNGSIEDGKDVCIVHILRLLSNYQRCLCPTTPNSRGDGQNTKYKATMQNVQKMCNLLEQKGFHLPNADEHSMPSSIIQDCGKVDRDLWREVRLEYLIREGNEGNAAAKREANELMQAMILEDEPTSNVSRKEDFKEKKSLLIELDEENEKDFFFEGANKITILKQLIDTENGQYIIQVLKDHVRDTTYMSTIVLTRCDHISVCIADIAKSVMIDGTSASFANDLRVVEKGDWLDAVVRTPVHDWQVTVHTTNI